MFVTTKHILGVLSSYGDQVTVLCPELKQDVFKDFKRMLSSFNNLPEEFRKLPGYVRNRSCTPTECDSKTQHSALILTITLRSVYTNPVLRTQGQ